MPVDARLRFRAAPRAPTPRVPRLPARNLVPAALQLQSIVGWAVVALVAGPALAWAVYLAGQGSVASFVSLKALASQPFNGWLGAAAMAIVMARIGRKRGARRLVVVVGNILVLWAVLAWDVYCYRVWDDLWIFLVPALVAQSVVLAGPSALALAATAQQWDAWPDAGGWDSWWGGKVRQGRPPGLLVSALVQCGLGTALALFGLYALWVFDYLGRQHYWGWTLVVAALFRSLMWSVIVWFGVPGAVHLVAGLASWGRTVALRRFAVGLNVAWLAVGLLFMAATRLRLAVQAPLTIPSTLFLLVLWFAPTLLSLLVLTGDPAKKWFREVEEQDLGPRFQRSIRRA